MNAAATAAAAEGSKPVASELNQKEARQFKSKAPKPGQRRFNGGLPGTEDFEDNAVVCPWEDFGEEELNNLAQFGII
ncbi:retinal cone rhodopsin-sensitive cGMP 3',5'-cyclic phosphodiesterase subunit gamma-like [Menidia menidia]|uniref:3',5'-cyclic-GMP phosphodiesterase n=1 Tax=Menidia menidia TaxID=238744 RepID=A0A8S4A5K5_9TELE|nr:unnamed protein product [Menidia menidia]